MTVPPGYIHAEWKDLHAGDRIYIAKNDGNGPYIVTFVTVVEPWHQAPSGEILHLVQWTKREHEDYGRDAKMVEVVTDISRIWPGWHIIRRPYVRIYPAGFRQATQAELRDGYELYVWAVTALGPFWPYKRYEVDGRITSMDLMNTRLKHNPIFRESADTIMVKV